MPHKCRLYRGTNRPIFVRQSGRKIQTHPITKLTGELKAVKGGDMQCTGRRIEAIFLLQAARGNETTLGMRSLLAIAETRSTQTLWEFIQGLFMRKCGSGNLRIQLDSRVFKWIPLSWVVPPNLNPQPDGLPPVAHQVEMVRGK